MIKKLIERNKIIQYIHLLQFGFHFWFQESGHSAISYKSFEKKIELNETNNRLSI